MDRKLSELILDIHRGSIAIPLRDFKQWVFKCMLNVLDFHSGVWVDGHWSDDERLVADDIYGFNQPSEIYQLREQFTEHQRLLRRMMLESGITLNRDMVVPAEEFRRLGIYKEYFAKHGMEHALGTVKNRPQFQLYSHVALYRDGSGPPFTEDDRLTKQALMPHILEAHKYCLFYHLIEAKYVDNRDVGKAVVSADGRLRELSDNFFSILGKKWPDWHGPYLPEAIREGIANSRKLAFSPFVVRFSHPANDLVGVELHPV